MELNRSAAVNSACLFFYPLFCSCSSVEFRKAACGWSGWCVVHVTKELLDMSGLAYSWTSLADHFIRFLIPPPLSPNTPTCMHPWNILLQVSKNKWRERATYPTHGLLVNAIKLKSHTSPAVHKFSVEHLASCVRCMRLPAYEVRLYSREISLLVSSPCSSDLIWWLARGTSLRRIEELFLNVLRGHLCWLDWQTQKHKRNILYTPRH